MDRPDEIDFDRYIPGHLQENYEQIVAERHGGDWSALGRQMAVDGNDLLSRWAHTKASEEGRSGPPRRRRSQPRERAVQQATPEQGVPPAMPENAAPPSAATGEAT